MKLFDTNERKCPVPGTADRRINSLLVSFSPSDLLAIRKIKDYLRLYPLRC